jgi:hypothetical protein
MPNTQRLLFINYSHMVGGPDMDRFMTQFLDDPYKKIEPGNKNIIAY